MVNKLIGIWLRKTVLTHKTTLLIKSVRVSLPPTITVPKVVPTRSPKNKTRRTAQTIWKEVVENRKN